MRSFFWNRIAGAAEPARDGGRLARRGTARRRARRLGLALALLPALAGAPAARADGVTVALQPAIVNVDPGAEFDLYVQVTEAGAPFNGLDAVLGFDPAAVTLLELSDAQQEGALLTSACADLFHRFLPATSSVKVSEVMLCNQTFVTGPGQAYRLRFRASTTPQVSTVTWLAGSHFYNSGLYVTPLNTSNAAIRIGTNTGVGSGPVAAGLGLRATPNPAFGATTLQVTAGTGPQELTVSDVQGRVVRHLASGDFGAGLRRVAWDGRSDAGGGLPAGVYLVTLRAGAASAQTRVLLLR